MRNVKCSYCEEYRNEWCEKVIDSPHPDILRDCQYFHEAKTRWIPCSERLPEDTSEKWVTVKGHDVIVCKDGETVFVAMQRVSQIRWVTTGFWGEDGEEKYWCTSDGYPMMVQPIAWMDIVRPEPWEG